MKRLALALVLIPSLVGLAWSAPARTSLPALTHDHITLSEAEVSQVAGDRAIITMRAVGALPGALTLMIDRNAADNTIVGGEWALVISYIRDTGVPHTDDGDHHPAGEEGVLQSSEELVREGTLKGTIIGGSVTLDSNGAVSSFSSVQLSVNSGTLKFADISSGTGLVHGIDLQSHGTSSGTLALNFRAH